METTVMQRIKELRNYLNLSQGDFASKINGSATSISRIENGLTEPRGKTIEKIITNTGVDREWLINGVGELKINDSVRVSDEGNKQSWSSRAYEAMKSKNEHLEQEVNYLREMLKQTISQMGQANFQSDVDHAGLFIKEKSVDIVRAAA